MPNEVYTRTRAGLATLVSPRAATRMLDDALLRSGLSADRLPADAVHDLLLGPVRSELEGILPPGGLRRTLRRLARTVRNETRSSHGRVPNRHPTRVGRAEHGARNLTPPERYDSQRVRQSSVYLSDVAVAQASEATAIEAAASAAAVAEAAPTETATSGAATRGAATREPAVTGDHGERLHADVDSSAAPRPGGPAHDAPDASVAVAAAVPASSADGTTAHPATRAQPAPSKRPVASRRPRRHHPTLVPATPGPAQPTLAPQALDASRLEGIVLGYAALDGVSQVAALDPRGAVATMRGQGVDTDALAPLLRTALHLLGKHGRLRSVVLEHAMGLLFVFPLGAHVIIVLTRPSINIGAVFAARAALEEGL